MRQNRKGNKRRYLRTSKELYELIDYFFSRNLFYKNDMTTLVMDDREGRCTVDTFYPFESMRVGLQNVVYQRPEKKKSWQKHLQIV